MNDNSLPALSVSVSAFFPLLTSHAGRRYLGAGKNSAAEVGDIRLCDVLSRWREETVNSNKADGFGLGGFYCTVFVMLLCAELFRGPRI